MRVGGVVRTASASRCSPTGGSATDQRAARRHRDRRARPAGAGRAAGGARDRAHADPEAPAPLGSGVTKPDRRVEIGSLRQATLRSVGDRACARTWRRNRGNGDERFDAAADGVRGRHRRAPPLSSACYGDSGGAMYAGSLARPVLIGVTSWVGPGWGAAICRPSAHASAVTARSRDPNPVWAPVASGPATVTGEPRVGATLTCTPAAWEVAPEQVEILWERPAARRPAAWAGAPRTCRATPTSARSSPATSSARTPARPGRRRARGPVGRRIRS